MKKFDALKNIINYPLTICFSVFIFGVFVLYFIFPDKELSEWENRYLAKAPEVRMSDIYDGSFMTKYEDYINDQIPFRDGFIKLKAISEACFLKIENNGIVRGKNSYLFTKTEDNTDVFDKNIGIISQFTENISNNVKVAIAPNAIGVLKNKVPTGMMCVDQGSKLSEITADKSLLKGAIVVDLKSVLDTHGDEYIYYQTDHHWTTIGAYYAYKEISDNPLNIDGFKVSAEDGFLGTLYAKYKGLFVTPDTIFIYDIPVERFVTDDIERASLIDRDKLSVFDKYGAFLYGNFGKSEITADSNFVSSNGKGKTLILFKDSYANCLVPFLTYDYEHIILIDLRYYKDSVQELMAANPNADVLFINNFDFLNEDNHFYKLLK